MSLLVALVAVLALVLASCSGSDAEGSAGTASPAGSTQPSSPGNGSTASSVVVTTVAPSSAPGRVPEGFGAVLVRVTQADGSVREWCVLLARTPLERARGLMEVDSLGRFDGMLFDFETETVAQFYMLRTRLPLSIAFLDGDGAFVSSTDMEPCPNDDDDPPCPRYSADAPYVMALEVPLGGLEDLGVGPGASIEVLPDPC
jgi:uncharacterized membrane protein (UPF0127 family)